MKLKGRRIIVASSLILTLTVGTPAWANPLSDQLAKQQKELQNNKNSYSSVEAKLNESEVALEKMDNQIETIMGQIQQINDNISQKKNEIDATEKQVQEEQDKIANEQSLFDQRIKALYMNGGVGSYLNILLEAKSFGDFISRMDTVSRIIIFDNSLLSDFKVKKEKVIVKQQQLLKENNELLALKAESQKQLADLNSTKSQEKNMMVKLSSQEKLYMANINKYQALIYETYDEIHKSEKSTSTSISTSKSNPSGASTASYSSNAIVAYATRFLGTPYVYGGNTPSGFDCSGFTKYVFAHFGINLQREAHLQATQGVPVSLNALEPGDLVFFGNPIYHVGIYVGNGLFIHAPHTGDVVRIAPLMWDQLTFARRIE